MCCRPINDIMGHAGLDVIAERRTTGRSSLPPKVCGRPFASLAHGFNQASKSVAFDSTPVGTRCCVSASARGAGEPDSDDHTLVGKPRKVIPATQANISVFAFFGLCEIIFN
jgi:hypothetical protein